MNKPLNTPYNSLHKLHGKDTKRKRIKRFELVYKWQTPDEVVSMERGLI